MSITIRLAKQDDCQGIFNVILKRNESQKQNSDVELSLEDLQRDGFDTKPAYFHCLVAEDGNTKLLGFALFYYRYSTWESKGLFLQCLAVNETTKEVEMVKEKLIKTLCKFGVDGDFCRISFREFASNSSELNFYQKLGALNLSKDEGWLLFGFPKTSILKILNDSEKMEDKCPNIIVRVAERRDCKDIAKYIKELAVFEKMGDEAKLAGEDLENDCFVDPDKHFRSFVAEDKEQGSVVGFAIFFNTYIEHVGKSIHLEDLYVTPKYRNSGVGKKLFTAVAKVTNDENYDGFTLECLDWNTPAIQFYEKNHGSNLTALKGILCCRFRRDVMETLQNTIPEK